MHETSTVVEAEEQQRISNIEAREREKAARFNQLVSEVDVGDKRKTRWFVYHDNMINV